MRSLFLCLVDPALLDYPTEALLFFSSFKLSFSLFLSFWRSLASYFTLYIEEEERRSEWKFNFLTFSFFRSVSFQSFGLDQEEEETSTDFHVVVGLTDLLLAKVTHLEGPQFESKASEHCWTFLNSRFHVLATTTWRRRGLWTLSPLFWSYEAITSVVILYLLFY